MKRNRKVKSPLSLELVRELDQLFQRFRASPSFEMLSNLPVTHLLNGPAANSPKLAGYNLRRLVELGAAKACGLPGLAAADAQDLKIAMEGLCASEPAAARPEDPAEIAPPPSESKERAFFASSEAEIRLSQALARLRSSDAFEGIKTRTLGEFWIESSPRSPFEECITFKQLAEMNLESFLRKKSFTAARIDAMMNAIENCLAFVSGGSEMPAAPARRESGKPQASEAAPAAWLSASDGLPSHLVAAVSHLVAELSRAGSRAIWEAMSEIHRDLSVREVGLLWLSSEHAEDVVAGILRYDPETISALNKSANEKLIGALARRCPEALAHLRSALSSPGVSLEDLVAPYRSGILSPNLERAVIRMISAALGSSPVRALGMLLDGYVTAKPEALELTLSGLLAGLPKDDARLRQEIGVLLPFMKPEAVFELISRKAKLDHAKSRWERTEPG